jgi:hypothetical protein
MKSLFALRPAFASVSSRTHRSNSTTKSANPCVSNALLVDRYSSLCVRIVLAFFTRHLNRLHTAREFLGAGLVDRTWILNFGIRSDQQCEHLASLSSYIHINGSLRVRSSRVTSRVPATSQGLPQACIAGSDAFHLIDGFPTDACMHVLDPRLDRVAWSQVAYL